MCKNYVNMKNRINFDNLEFGINKMSGYVHLTRQRDGNLTPHLNSLKGVLISGVLQLD